MSNTRLSPKLPPFSLKLRALLQPLQFFLRYERSGRKLPWFMLNATKVGHLKTRKGSPGTGTTSFASANTILVEKLAVTVLFWRVSSNTKKFSTMPASYAHYDACLAGKLRLIPGGDDLLGLESDYNSMRTVGILKDDAPDFETLIEQIRVLEEKVNNWP